MYAMRKILLFLLLCGISTNGFSRQDSVIEKRIYQVTALEGKGPAIDGHLSDKAWSSAVWAGDFIQHIPYDGKPPTSGTRFKIIHDKEYIYVAIEAFDPAPDSIVRRMTRRDEIEGDFVFVDFDSYHDLRTCFEFIVTAGGVKGDLIFANNGNDVDDTWDPVWWVETSIGDEGWIAEMKIPFSQLRFDNSESGVWGLLVGRNLYRKEELSLWQHIPPDSPGMIHLFGELHGMKDVQPRKQAEVTPYVTGGAARYEADPENPFLTGRDRILNAGVDAKFGITNNLTLDLSVNPDFGQVEADPSEVNLSAYETFFREKRPLFIEGKSIYNFPLGFGDGGQGSHTLFYSRRIGRNPHYSPELGDNEYADEPGQTNILAAAKISGKTKNGTSVGVLESITAREVTSVERAGEREEVAVEPLTNYFVARVVQDMNEGNTILGGIATSTYRDIKDANLTYLPVSATSGGIDFQQYWGDKGYSVKLVNYFSHVTGTEEAITELQRSPAHLFQRPDAGYLNLDSTRNSLSGFGGSLQLEKTSGKFNVMFATVWKSPGLEINDLGYFRIGDEIMEVLWAGYNLYEPFSIFRRMHISANQYRAWDFGGYLALGGFEGGVQTMFKNFWSAGMNFNVNGDVRYNTFLRGGPAFLLPGSFSYHMMVETDNRKKLVIETGFRLERGFLDHEHSMAYGLEVEYRPFDALNLSLEPEYRKSFTMLQYVAQETTSGQDRYIFSSIEQNILSVSIRANLTLTPELTIQYWGQPFLACGDYHDFKYITEGLADEFSDRFHLYGSDEITPDPVENIYSVTEAGTGTDPYTFENPDFKVREFLSNMVLRWEYRPGSYLYAVWSQSRNGFDENPEFAVHNDLPEIWNIRPRNTFLIKLSYRIGR